MRVIMARTSRGLQTRLTQSWKMTMKRPAAEGCKHAQARPGAGLGAR